MLHTVLVVGAGLILALLGGALFAPLAVDLLPSAERDDPCACTEPD